jgi:prophage maintenance system killer protein
MSVNLFEMIKGLNRFHNHNAAQFQDHKERKLLRCLQKHQEKIDSNEILNSSEIVDIAINIFVNQIFSDANHRTAIHFIYVLHIHYGVALDIEAYKLYGVTKSIDMIEEIDDSRFGTVNFLIGYLSQEIEETYNLCNNSLSFKQILQEKQEKQDKSKRLLDAILSENIKAVRSENCQNEIKKVNRMIQELPKKLRELELYLNEKNMQALKTKLKRDPSNSAFSPVNRQATSYLKSVSPLTIFSKSPSSHILENFSPKIQSMNSNSTLCSSHSSTSLPTTSPFDIGEECIGLDISNSELNTTHDNSSVFNESFVKSAATEDECDSEIETSFMSSLLDVSTENSFEHLTLSEHSMFSNNSDKPPAKDVLEESSDLRIP